MAYIRAILLGPWGGKRNPGIAQLGAIAGCSHKAKYEAIQGLLGRFVMYGKSEPDTQTQPTSVTLGHMHAEVHTYLQT